MKRFFSLFIAVALFGCLPVPASAAGQEKISEMGYVQTAPSTTKHVTADMLLDLGYTQERAENLLEFDRILKKMEAFGQVIDYAEGEFIITPCPMDGLDYVTAAERNHLIRMLTPYVEHAGQQAAPGSPGKGAPMSIKAADMEEEGVSPAPITTSWEKTHVFFSAGTKHVTFTITETADIYMSTNVIDAYFTCDANSLTLLKVTGSQSSAGYVKVGSHAYMPGYHETVRITQTGNWVDARNEVMFGVRESVGLPLSAILGVSMDVGGDWMQKAILRGFKTEGLGHVCEIAEVTIN